MKKIIGRKGDLTQNVLSLIIAALGIALLVFAAYKLYRANVENEEENATKLLNSLDEKIKNLKDGEIGRFPIRGVNGWYLTGWGKDDYDRPDRCYFDNCLCVCYGESDLKTSCQEKGICRKHDRKVSVIGFFEIEVTSTDDFGGSIVTGKRKEERAAISFGKNLIEIEIKKEPSQILIKEIQ